MQAYQTPAPAVVRRFDGYIAHYIGDGLLVYFGYPQAHEDDAAAGRADGLGDRRGMQPCPSRTCSLPQAFAGAHWHSHGARGGRGDGGRDYAKPWPCGETPNIAARVQEQAAPNNVVISPATARLVAGLFDCQDLGRQELKGVSTPLTLYQVVKRMRSAEPLSGGGAPGSRRLWAGSTSSACCVNAGSG